MINKNDLKLKKLESNEHEIGKTYFDGYWNKVYKVIDIVEDKIFGKCVKCLWADGHINEHCTKLDINKDYEVID